MAESQSQCPLKDLGFLASFLKAKVLLLLLFVSVISTLLAGGGLVDIAYVIAAGTLAVTGSTLLNQYLESDVDALMERTMQRPLPLGLTDSRTMLWAGLLTIAAGTTLAYTKNPEFAAFVLLGAAIYVIIYTAVLKRRTWMNIVIGGSAGSCAVLAGWTAVRPLELLPVLLAVYLFMWTPTHFWAFAIAKKDDYERADIPMLPAVVGERKTVAAITVNSISTVLFTVLMYQFLQLGGVYLMAAVVLGVSLLAIHLPLLMDPSSKERAYRLFKSSNYYLAALFLAVLLDSLL